MAEQMRVWIDQDLCTGDGLCEATLPAVFGRNDDDGLYYVKEPHWPDIYGPDEAVTDADPKIKHGQGQTTRPDYVSLPPELLDTAIEAAEDCPGECIFIEAE